MHRSAKVPGKVDNSKDDIVTRRLLAEDHRKKALNVDILEKKSELLRSRLDELRDAYKLTRQEFWPCTIYADMDRMIQRCIVLEEPERRNSERVRRGGPIGEVKQRLYRQSTIARELMAREESYQVMTIQELRNDIARLDMTLVDLRNRTETDDDRLNQLTIDYENSRHQSPLLRYFRLRGMISRATR